MTFSVFGVAGHRTGETAAPAIKLLLSAFLLIVLAAGQAAANSKYAGIIIDARTGKTLYENSADEHRYPASLTKMMTLYLTFEALDAGRITKDSRIPVSRNAANEVPSKLGLRAGQTLTVEQAIKALVTKSANDAATALGEYLGGSESHFATLMTKKAHQLGMSRTTFKNAHGLPNPEQKTTARDMARLGIALREHFPNHYHYFSTRSFKFGSVTYGNHNRLLGSVRGVDGIKTGYIRASGFNLVSSVKDDGRMIVGVVMGGRTGASRDAQMRELIAKYLPKASQGHGDGNLIARSGPSPMLAANAWSLPETGPIPVFRSPIDVRVAAAYAPNVTSNALAAFPVPDERPVVGREALAAVLRAQQPEADAGPVPPVAVGDTDVASASVDTVTTASTAEAAAPDAAGIPNGWVVQVAAMPDRQQAMAYLSNAQAEAGGAVAEAEPFTVAFNNDGEQLYRARFGGFDGKDAAWAACASLKKQGYGCWATEQ